MSLATFAISTDGRRVEGDFACYPNKVVFKAGDYPAHGLSLSADEMAASLGRLTGTIAGNIEHTSFLAGKAVFLDKPRVDDKDPMIMRADVRVPLWLDEHLGTHEKKLSAEWNKATKDFAGVALCVNPAITEADLMATFAKAHSTPHGTSVMQRIHDHAAGSGAYCDPQDAGKGNSNNANAMFVSRSERGGLQKIHDHAVEHGAKCPGGMSYFSHNPKKGAKMPVLTKLLPLLNGLTDLTADEKEEVLAKFATVETTKAVTPAPVVEPVKAPEIPVVAPVVETADFSKNAEFVALKAKADATEKQNAVFAARLLDNDAEKWADGEIAAKRAIAPEKADLIALFVQATTDDNADNGLARFTAPAKAIGASRVELLKAVFAKRPAHMLFEEFVVNDAPEGSVVVQPKAKFSADKTDPAQMEQLRGFTNLLPAKKA